MPDLGKDEARYVVVRRQPRFGGGHEDQVEYVRPVHLDLADEQMKHLRTVAAAGGRTQDTYRIAELRDIAPDRAEAPDPRTEEVRHLAEVITDAHLQGVYSGPWTLARMILAAGYRRQFGIRYVFLGPPEEAARFRMQRGLPYRMVTVVWSNTAALRGLSGPIEVVTSERWSEVPPEFAAVVRRDLELVRASTSVQPGSDTRSYPTPTDQGGPQ